MKNKKIYQKTFIVFFTVLLLVLTFLCGQFSFPAYASTKYSNVLDDLKKDEEFNISEYPDKPNDYSIQVIQIAESSARELYIYTYQPCQMSQYIVATAINMALTKELGSSDNASDMVDMYNEYYTSAEGYDGTVHGGGGIRPRGLSTFSENEASTQTKPYSLTFLNSEGTLCKYKVNDFTVSSESVRYYNITSIYRKWNSAIDGVQTGSQTIGQKAYPVGQRWTVGTVGTKVVYDAEEVEVIKVTDQAVGFRRYAEGYRFMDTAVCDAHYLVFSCDHPIDRLISAEVSFYTRDYKALKGSSTKYGDKVLHNRTLYDFEKVEIDGSGIGNGGDYVFDRLSRTDDFISSLREQGSTITEEEVSAITQYDWVLNFYETEYAVQAGGLDVLLCTLVPLGFVGTIVRSCTTTGTIVSDVTLMQLEFQYQGHVYNMGVVSDRQTGPDTPSGVEVAPAVKGLADLWQKIVDFFKGHSSWWVYLIFAIVILLVVLIVVKVLSLFFPIFGAILKAVWWVITSPVRLIKWIVQKARGE